MNATLVPPLASSKTAPASAPSKAGPQNDGDSHRERAACPLYTAIGVIDGRWKPMIYQRLASRALGFGGLERAMPGVRRKVLREQLRQMQADGLVTRHALMPPRLGVRYRLTPYGRTLGPVFITLWQWGVRHLARKHASRGTQVKAPVSRPE